MWEGEVKIQILGRGGGAGYDGTDGVGRVEDQRILPKLPPLADCPCSELLRTFWSIRSMVASVFLSLGVTLAVFTSVQTRILGGGERRRRLVHRLFFGYLHDHGLY